MSLGKLTETVGGLGEEFKGLTLDQIKEKILSQLHTAYGRYENVTGSMAFEMSHADSDTAGQVRWQKFEGEEMTENVVIGREDAIKRFMVKMQLGYQRVFEGVTAADLAQHNAQRIATKSAIDREGLLGTYRNRDKETIRITEPTKGLYTIEKGWDGLLSSVQVKQTETSVRSEIEFARDAGYIKDGEEWPDDNGKDKFLRKFFGEEVEEDEPQPEPETNFNPAWFNQK